MIGRALGKHFRSNVIGYIALFCFAISGTADALPGLNLVDSGDIKNRQVKRKDLAYNSVGAQNVIDGSLTNADLAAGILAGITGPAGPKGDPGPVGPAGPQGPAGTISTGSVTATGLADGSVTNPKLADNAVTSPKLATGSVTSDEIATDAVNAIEIADESIDGGEIVDNSLFAADLGADSAGSSEVQTNAIGSSEVANNSLTGADLDGADLSGGGINIPTGYVPNGRCRQVDASVGGAEAGQAVLFSVQAALQDGVMIYGQRVPSDGHVTFDVCNFSGTTQTAISDLPVHVLTFE